MASARTTRFAILATSLGTLGALFAACSIDEVVNPVPTGAGGASSSSTSTTSSSSSSSGGEGGKGGAASASSSSSSGAGGEGGADAGQMDAGPDDASMEAEVACTSAVTTFMPDPSPHYPVCSVIAYSTNPPTSGPHYPIWAAYKAYSTPIPRGFWVHDLEHGAAVITYNCPSDCSAEVASLMAFLAARPPDPICVPPLTARIVITPDPLLDTMFAVSAWGAHLKSNCFDLPALGAFLDLYYGKGPEASCFDGVDLSTGVPEGCGEPIDAGGMDSGPG